MMSNQDYFWLALPIALLTAGVVIWALNRMKLRRARMWPTEVGCVDSSVLSLRETGEAQSAWFAVVKYSYTVQGTAYSGELRRKFILNKSAEKWIGRYGSGLPLTIRYDPNDAKASVIFESEQIGAKQVGNPISLDKSDPHNS